MLPNRMCLDRSTEEKLKRYKQTTGIAPNAASRLAFFHSIESGFKFDNSETNLTLDGQMTLDKITWLGDCQLIVEQILCLMYPKLSDQELSKAWACHVKDGFKKGALI